MVNIKGINGRNQSEWTYPDLDLAKRPVAHSDEIPVPSFTHLEELPKDESSTSAVDSTCWESDSDFEGTSSVAEDFGQPELNDLIRELNLLKKSAKLLASRLAEKNLKQLRTKITYVLS